MNGAVTIQSAIDELQRMYKLLNKKYFNNELEKVIITIQADHKGAMRGWISAGKVWSTKNKEYYREINICAECLNRDTSEVIEILLHEMCHLWNMQNDIQDTSRSGTYHNKLFMSTAERSGLSVDFSKQYGYAHTKPKAELKEIVEKHCRAGCFKLNRASFYRDGKTPKNTAGTGEGGKEQVTSRAKQNMKKFVCPVCGLIIRAGRDITGKVLCIACNVEFVHEAPAGGGGGR
jgi:hypothetical protein